MPKWGIGDKRCQLCFSANGSVEHRYECKHTCPPSGRSKLPTEALLAANRLNAERKRILKSNGLLALKVPARKARRGDSFTWSAGPPDVTRGDCKWYIDGSMINGRWNLLATAGFGIVVVADDGELLASGWGIPPSWVDSASAAEAWALFK